MESACGVGRIKLYNYTGREEWRGEPVSGNGMEAGEKLELERQHGCKKPGAAFISSIDL